MKNLEKIFLYFSRPGTYLLFYKDFIKEIFYFAPIRDTNIKYKKNNFFENLSFIEELTRKIINRKGIYTLLDLIKNIKIIDYECIKRISVNDFFQVLEKSEIYLDDTEKEKIFIESEFYLNGIIKYEVMTNLILEQFWDEQKNNLCEEIYCFLTNNGKKYISLNSIQKIVDNRMNEDHSKQKLLNFIENYKLINNKISINPVSLKEFKNFCKYYNFGHSSQKCLKQLISVMQPKIYYDDNDFRRYSQISNYFKESNYPKKNHLFSKSMDKNYYSNNRRELFRIIKKLRNIFIEYGRRAFFNFIKQFRYYENNGRQIDRNNFKSVLNSYNINLTVEEINIIFKKFSIDEYKNFIFYEDFLKYIAVNSSNKRREEIIKYVYDIIIDKAEKYNRELDLDFLKEIYNSKNNFFIKDETDNNLDFIDCLEIFHYYYKSFKSNKFYRKEFIDYYRFISFLIYLDDDFISLILNEWRISPNYLNNFLLSLNNAENNNINIGLFPINNINTYFLLELKEKLINKGIKGLINFHWKFIKYCSDVSKISLYNFINILELEHINFGKNDYNDIFSYFSSDSNKEYLDYNRFIRFFKKELNDNKLNIVEKVFLSLKYDTEDNEEIPLNEIKKKYSARRHPEVIWGKKTEDEKIREFRESFDINYEIANLDQVNNKVGKFVDFQTFANYYEYVSFIYSNDEDFTNLLISTWC